MDKSSFQQYIYHHSGTDNSSGRLDKGWKIDFCDIAGNKRNSDILEISQKHIPGTLLIVTLILRPVLLADPSEENLIKSVFPLEVMALGISSPHNWSPIKGELEMFPSRTSNQSNWHVLPNSKSKATNSRRIFSPLGNTTVHSQFCIAGYWLG